MNVNSAHKCLFKVYTRSMALGVGPFQISQQGYHSNVCHVVLRFRLTLCRSLQYFLVLLLLTLNILCLLWMSLNSTLRYIFVEHQIGVMFWELLQNISSQLCRWLALWGALYRYSQSTLARKHARYVATWARKHARHVVT